MLAVLVTVNLSEPFLFWQGHNTSACIVCLKTMPGGRHCWMALGWSRILTTNSCFTRFHLSLRKSTDVKIESQAFGIFVINYSAENKTQVSIIQVPVWIFKFNAIGFDLFQSQQVKWLKWFPALRKAGSTLEIYLFCFLLTCKVRLPKVQWDEFQQWFGWSAVIFNIHAERIVMHCPSCQSHLIRWIRMMNHSGAVC